MGRLAGLFFPLALGLASPALIAGAPPPATLVYAAQPGRQAFDGDAHGGNPFATAVVASLSRGKGDDRTEIVEATLANSGGGQRPQTPSTPLELAPQGQAIALIIVFADYGDDADGLASLPGAAFDAARVHRAAQRAGYRATFAVVTNRADYLDSLARFYSASRRADVALLYTTGHGFGVRGSSWIIPPDFPVTAPGANWRERAIEVESLGAGLRARRANIVAYAGCRDNPLGLD